MVIAERSDTSMRYRLLETLRQYAEERLDDRAETADLRDRHLAHYIDIANTARFQWLSPEQLTANAVFGREWDNLRAAHNWAYTTGDLEACDSLIISTGFHAANGLRDEHREWTERTLALGDKAGSSTPTTLALGAV